MAQADTSGTTPGSVASAPEYEVSSEFEVVKQIGAGSFAVVWRARRKKDGKEVAVKEIATDKLNKKLLESLDSEISILKRASHPNIISLLDIRKAKGKMFLVMEYCGGGDLAVYIRKHGRADETTARHFMEQLSAGLKTLRAHNLIHRDLKPQNLLLTADSADATLKIADFGFARSIQPQGLAETLCGSPLYMAPEILQYQKYDAKADLWSVGTILYELVCGRPPFGGANHLQLLRNIERKEATIPSVVASELSPQCVDLIKRLLRRNPVERLTFEEFFTHPFMTANATGPQSASMYYGYMLQSTAALPPAGSVPGTVQTAPSSTGSGSQVSGGSATGMDPDDCMPFALDDDLPSSSSQARDPVPAPSPRPVAPTSVRQSVDGGRQISGVRGVTPVGLSGGGLMHQCSSRTPAPRGGEGRFLPQTGAMARAPSYDRLTLNASRGPSHGGPLGLARPPSTSSLTGKGPGGAQKLDGKDSVDSLDIEKEYVMIDDLPGCNSPQHQEAGTDVFAAAMALEYPPAPYHHQGQPWPGDMHRHHAGVHAAPGSLAGGLGPEGAAKAPEQESQVPVPLFAAAEEAGVPEEAVDLEAPAVQRRVRAGSLLACGRLLSDLAQAHWAEERQLCALSVQLLVLQVFQLCLEQSSASVRASLPGSEGGGEDLPELGGSGRGGAGGSFGGIGFSGLGELGTTIKSDFVEVAKRAQDMAGVVQKQKDAAARMPDAIELVFQAALSAGRSGAVEELIGNVEQARAAYAKGTALLYFIFVEASSLGAEPALQLTNSAKLRIRRYASTIGSRYRACKEGSPGS